MPCHMLVALNEVRQKETHGQQQHEACGAVETSMVQWKDTQTDESGLQIPELGLMEILHSSPVVLGVAPPSM